jgi:uncharacterized membrane protein
MLYLLLKTIHILSVITALGTNLTYGFLTFKAEREPQHLPFMLRTIHWLDSKVANRSYMVVLATGLLLVWVNKYSFLTLWIWLSLSLFIIIAFMGIALYAPVLRQQIEFAEKQETHLESYRIVSRKSKRLGILVTLLVVIILALMVTKPTL